MQIEVTPKIAAYIEMTMAAGSAQSPVGAIESLIDAALGGQIDPHTGMKIDDLRPLLDVGLAELSAGAGIPADEVWSRVMGQLSTHD